VDGVTAGAETPEMAASLERTDMAQGTHKLSMPERRADRDETATAVVDDVFSALVVGRDIQGRDQVTTGVVEDISPDGVARVVLSGATASCEASSLVKFASPAAAVEALLGRSVLVLVNAAAQPVILGAVTRRLWDTPEKDVASEARAELPADKPLAVQLDKRVIDLVASDEIRLTCGKSSFVMRRDGTVIVRGVNIVSRASQSNKVRGGTISLN
jgi:hypothetical protein